MKQSEILRKQEKRVIEMMCQNFSEDEIAEILNVSVHTIKSHVSKLMRMKLLKKDFISVPEDFKNSAKKN